MQLTPRVVIRDLPDSPAIESHILEKIDKLDQFYDRIMRCDVVVEQAQKHKNKGKLFNIRLVLTVPGDELSINRSMNEDVYVAIRDAFNDARRRLQDYAKKRRSNVKHHELPMHGFIIRLFDEGFGFIESNGDEYYFADANVAYPSFDELKEGTEVTFITSSGSEGLQAKRVSAGKHHRGVAEVEVRI